MRCLDSGAGKHIVWRNFVLLRSKVQTTTFRVYLQALLDQDKGHFSFCVVFGGLHYVACTKRKAIIDALPMVYFNGVRDYLFYLRSKFDNGSGRTFVDSPWRCRTNHYESIIIDDETNWNWRTKLHILGIDLTLATDVGGQVRYFRLICGCQLSEMIKNIGENVIFSISVLYKFFPGYSTRDMSFQ